MTIKKGIDKSHDLVYYKVSKSNNNISETNLQGGLIYGKKIM